MVVLRALRALDRVELRPVALALAAILIGVCDEARTRAGPGLLSGGVLDETAHLCTGLLVVGALVRRPPGFTAALLASSVLIDLDHIPQHLGHYWLTAGTPRPYPHSLLTLLVVALVAVPRTRLRPVALGALAGLAAHLWRDMGEPSSGVALLWPVSDHSFSIPYGAYAAFVLVLLAIGLARRAPG